MAFSQPDAPRVASAPEAEPAEDPIARMYEALHALRPTQELMDAHKAAASDVIGTSARNSRVARHVSVSMPALVRPGRPSSADTGRYKALQDSVMATEGGLKV